MIPKKRENLTALNCSSRFMRTQFGSERGKLKRVPWKRPTKKLSFDRKYETSNSKKFISDSKIEFVAIPES